MFKNRPELVKNLMQIMRII